MKKIFRNSRGVVVFGLMTASTLLWFVPIMPLAVIKLVLPIPKLQRAITRVLMVIGEIWVSTNTAILKSTGSIDWRIRGIENLRRDGWYLVISNHQTWVDVFVLQELLNRRVPFLKFFIKQQLVWFPFLGLIWWAMDMPFMKRHSPSYLARKPHMKGKDLETTRSACEKFRNTPTSVLNFIEGTRFSDAKREARNSPYLHLLQPRAGGFAVAVSAMGELFSSVVDVTLFYPNGPAKFWDMCCGGEVIVLAEAREITLDDWIVRGDYQNDRVFRKRMHAWLGDIWQQKDATITAIEESIHG